MSFSDLTAFEWRANQVKTIWFGHLTFHEYPHSLIQAAIGLKEGIVAQSLFLCWVVCTFVRLAHSRKSEISSESSSPFCLLRKQLSVLHWGLCSAWGGKKIGEAKTHERWKGYQGITEHSSAVALPKKAPISLQKYFSAISLPLLWAEPLVFGWFSLTSGVHSGTHHLPADGKHRLSMWRGKKRDSSLICLWKAVLFLHSSMQRVSLLERARSMKW